MIDITTEEILNKVRAHQSRLADTAAGSVSASREQLNNSNNSNNSITQAINLAGKPTGDWAGEITTPSSFGEEKKEVSNIVPAGSVSALRDDILGIEVQLKKITSTGRLLIHATIQTAFQSKPLLCTGYLFPRDRAREFKIITELDRSLYDLTKNEHKHWLLGHLTERGTKRLLQVYCLTFDPQSDQLVLWFSDHSECIQIPTNNKSITPNQQRSNYTSAGVWGQPINLPKKPVLSLRDVTVFAGGNYD